MLTWPPAQYFAELVSCFCRPLFSQSSYSFCSCISTFPVNPPALPNLLGFGPFGWAQNQTVLKGLEVLTGTVSDLCLSCHELSLVLLKTSKPVVQVCLYAAQLTFGIPAFQSAAHGTICLPPELNDAACLILDKSIRVYECAYVLGACGEHRYNNH